MDAGLHDAIVAESAQGENNPFSVISLEKVRLLAGERGLAPLEVEVAALEAGVVPERYQRNIGTVGIEGQLKLLRSRVGVCGLGGLGGYVAEELARFGVGSLVLVDGDVFEENNLNRQLLCRESDLGMPKAEVAAERVRAVNSSLAVTAYRRFVRLEDILEVFSSVDVVVDALDNVTARIGRASCRERV